MKNNNSSLNSSGKHVNNTSKKMYPELKDLLRQLNQACVAFVINIIGGNVFYREVGVYLIFCIMLRF